MARDNWQPGQVFVHTTGTKRGQQPRYTTQPATILEKRGPTLCLGASHQKGVICDAEESGGKDSG